MSKQAKIFMHGKPAGILIQDENLINYTFHYDKGYSGPAISHTLPIKVETYTFTKFPAFFEGLLPEGVQLEALLRLRKIDRNDLFNQLIVVGHDLVGAVTVEEII